MRTDERTDGRTDRRTDMTKAIGAFHDYARAPINHPIDVSVQVVLVLRSSCIPKKVGVNQKGVNQKLYSHNK